jgi:hypothetical protein
MQKHLCRCSGSLAETAEQCCGQAGEEKGRHRRKKQGVLADAA